MAKAERGISCHVPFFESDTDLEIGFYIIERYDGIATTPQEARKILDPFGKIKYCQPVSPLERGSLVLNEGGVLVSFQMYDMGQAAMQVRLPLLAFPLGG
jgi:hypothetical protein